MTTRTLDIADGRFGDLPTDFTYLLHIAADFSAGRLRPRARVNAEGTGFVLEHCRTAKAALVMSTVTTYKPHPDPWHAFREDDPLGDAMAPPSAPYSVSKIARGGGRALLRPIVRPAGHDRPHGRRVQRPGRAAGLAPGRDRRRRARPDPVGSRCPTARSTTTTSVAQLEPLLDAASVPATIVNWGGDEPVSVQEWSAYFGELLGVEAKVVVEEIPGASDRFGRRPHEAHRDHRPVPVGWREGFRRVAEHFHPDRVRSGA